MCVYVCVRKSFAKTQFDLIDWSMLESSQRSYLPIVDIIMKNVDNKKTRMNSEHCKIIVRET